MAQPLRSIRTEEIITTSVVPRQGPAYQTYQILRFVFTVAPLVAGVDKFFHALVNWDQYLAPVITRTLGVSAHSMMLVFGGIEIFVALGVAIRPKVFSPIVSLWLMGIVINLLIGGVYYDIALRDFGLSLCAFALSRLSGMFDQPRTINSIQRSA